MPKYLIEAKYTAEGVKGILKQGGTSRRKATEAAVSSVGGTLEAFYFAFGEADVYAIGDVPDNVTMAALALTISAAGAVAVKTSVLVTPEEIDAAVNKAPNYNPPG